MKFCLSGFDADIVDTAHAYRLYITSFFVAIGMTGAGLSVILVLVFLAFAALLTATLYVLYRYVGHAVVHYVARKP